MIVRSAQRQLPAPKIAGLLPAPSDTASYAWKCPECGRQVHGSYAELKRPREEGKCWACMENITFTHIKLARPRPETFICKSCKRTYKGRVARIQEHGWLCPSCDGTGGLYYVGPVRLKGPAKRKLASAGPGWQVSYDGDWTWLKFDEKPDEFVLRGVRALGFRWSKKRREWYSTKPIAIEKLVEKTGLAAVEAAPVPKSWQERHLRTSTGERPGEEATQPPREERKPGERSLEIGLNELAEGYRRSEQLAAAAVQFLLDEARRTGGKAHMQTGYVRWTQMVGYAQRKLDAQLVQGSKLNEPSHYSWRDGDNLVMLKGENYKGGQLLTLTLLDPPPAEEPASAQEAKTEEPKVERFRGRPVWEVSRDEYTGAIGGPPVGIFLDCSPSQFAGMSKRAQDAYLNRNNEKREKRSAAATSWSAMVIEAYDNGLFDLETEGVHQDARDQVRRTLSARKEVAIRQRISELNAPFKSIDEIEVGDVICWYAGALGYGEVLRKYKHSIRVHFFRGGEETSVKWGGCSRMQHREAEVIALDEFGYERVEYNGSINFFPKKGARDKRFAPELEQLNEAQRAKLREIEERVAAGKTVRDNGERLLLRDLVLTKTGQVIVRIAGRPDGHRENAGGVMLCKNGDTPPQGANPMSIEKGFEVLYIYPELYPIPAGVKAKYVTPKEA